MKHNTGFDKGEDVVLIDGPYEGTPGIFLRLRADIRWADIGERNGTVRSHPVVWLAHGTNGINDVVSRRYRDAGK